MKTNEKSTFEMKVRRRQVRGVIVVVVVEYYIILIKIVVDVPRPRPSQTAAERVSFLTKGNVFSS